MAEQDQHRGAADRAQREAPPAREVGQGGRRRAEHLRAELAHGDLRWSYAELRRRAAAFDAALDGLGLDRVKDMIITGRENVYSVEVENAIYQHPDVMECAVFGVPDERWGEQVHAVIVCRPGPGADEAAIIDHCRGLIAGYKVPRSVEFRADALPKSGARKILKRELRRLYWEGRERQVS